MLVSYPVARFAKSTVEEACLTTCTVEPYKIFGSRGTLLFTTTVDNAHMCEPLSSQPGWLEQV